MSKHMDSLFKGVGPISGATLAQRRVSAVGPDHRDHAWTACGDPADRGRGQRDAGRRGPFVTPGVIDAQVHRPNRAINLTALCAADDRQGVVRIGGWRTITSRELYSVGRVRRLESGGDDANYRRRAAWHTRARHNS